MDCTAEWDIHSHGKLRDIHKQHFDSAHFDPGRFCFNLIRPGCHIINNIILLNGILNTP